MANGERNANWQGSKWIRPEKRLAVYYRDGFACVYCRATAEDATGGLSLDHVLAAELGGSNEATNLVTCCTTCNSSKQDSTMREWFATLRDRGVDTTDLAARIRAACARKLDMAVGKRLLAARKGGAR